MASAKLCRDAGRPAPGGRDLASRQFASRGELPCISARVIKHQVVAGIAGLMLFAAAAAAQCAPQWLPGDLVAVPTGPLRQSLSWDPDGAGPAAPLLVVAGRLTAGPVANVGVAAWDGSQWLALGTPPAGVAKAMIVHLGALVVAFETAYAVTTVASWNGSSWQTMGTFSGGTDYVKAFAIFQGSLYAGGDFTSVNGIPAARVASWNGTSWSAAGSGQPRNVLAIVPFSNAIYVASYDSSAAVGYLATWTGTAWTNIATCNGLIESLTVRNTATLATSFLWASGNFSQWTGSNGTIAAARVVRFSPTANAWTAQGTNLTGHCYSVFARAIGQTNYELVTAQSGSNQGLWAWNGTSWVLQGATVYNPNHVSYHAGAYHVTSFGGTSAAPVLRLAAGVWTPLTQASTALDPIKTVLDAGAEAVVGGAFGIRQGNPGAWNTIGGGLIGEVSTLARLANGDLVAGGTFAIPGGAVALRIARWNGAAWSSLTATMNGLPRSLLALPDGGLVVGGEFTSIDGVSLPYIAQWNGSAWQPIGGGMNALVTSVVRMPNGDIVAGGDFTLAGGVIGFAQRLARWNGSAWSQFGTGVNGLVTALAVQPDGHLVVATPADLGHPSYRAMRGNGGAWSVLPITFVADAVVAQPNGDLVFGNGQALHRLTGATVANYQLGGFAGSVLALRAAANGDLLVGGFFTNLGPVVAVNFARLAVTCPASAVAYGSGCTGAGGPDVLTALTLPWDASTLRTRATGLPTPSLALVIYGFSQIAVPIAALLPEGLPGCTLLVAPDILGLALPNAGMLDSDVFIPSVPSLVGATFFHQVVPVELDGGGQVSGITATNGLALTVGAN
jgi:hypothetical protein